MKTKKPVVVSASEIIHAATALAKEPTDSTRYMEFHERAAGIEQMLLDLQQLANRDGCIAAAWALEYLLHVAQD